MFAFNNKITIVKKNFLSIFLLQKHINSLVLKTLMLF
jgi:hypothetical protein